jgi:hypothetical protein
MVVKHIETSHETNMISDLRDTPPQMADLVLLLLFSHLYSP